MFLFLTLTMLVVLLIRHTNDGSFIVSRNNRPVEIVEITRV
jgi:hypothetical protein